MTDLSDGEHGPANLPAAYLDRLRRRDKQHPKDSVVVARVLGDVNMFPDLYPTLAALDAPAST